VLGRPLKLRVVDARNQPQLSAPAHAQLVQTNHAKRRVYSASRTRPSKSKVPSTESSRHRKNRTHRPQHDGFAEPPDNEFCSHSATPVTFSAKI